MYKVIGVDQRVYGPITGEQVRQWLAEGRLNAASLAQVEGAADWKPLSVFPEFVPPPIMAPPPAWRPAADNCAGNLATAGLVCGVLSNFCCCFGFLLAIAGLIFSIAALQRTENQPSNSSRTMAWIGLAFSILGLVIGFLLPLASGMMGGFWHRRRWHYL